MQIMYTIILDKYILYGCEVWYSNTAQQDLKLAQIQRSCMLLVTKAYRTVSSEALLVWASVLSIEYTALYLFERGVFDINLFGVFSQK